jgi:hypothetical protein
VIYEVAALKASRINAYSSDAAICFAVKLFLIKCRNRRSWHVIHVRLRDSAAKNKTSNYEIRTAGIAATRTVTLLSGLWMWKATRSSDLLRKDPTS